MYISLEIITLELDNNKKGWNYREMIVLIFTNVQKLIHTLSSSLILTLWKFIEISNNISGVLAIPQNS